jgi:UDP-N-acetylglucosamine:LPS N-acetylglucosamine transferase
MVDGLTDITLHESLPTLAPLIASADLALGAGGATSLERCCLGLPSIIVTLADNQRPGAAELHRQGLVEWLGDDGEVSVEAIASAVGAALNKGCDEAMSGRCLELLDGRGGALVSSEISRLGHQSFGSPSTPQQRGSEKRIAAEPCPTLVHLRHPRGS